MTMPNVKHLTVAAVAGAMLALPAAADTLEFTADLSGANEVPANDSPATGSAEVTVDTDAHTVSWTVEVEDLSGDPVAEHIHGPAEEGENASPMIDMSDAIMEGSGDITDEQIQSIEDGKTYVNVHTEKFPKGEIRGQLVEAD